MTGLISTIPSRAFTDIGDALMDGQSVMLWGPAGCAKSDIGRQIAAKYFDNVVIDIRLGLLEPADLVLPVPNIANNNFDRLPWSGLPDAKRHGERGLLFLDEITSAPPASAVMGYQAALDRMFGDKPIPEKWGVMAAGNRQGDKGVTYQMAAPLANRFMHFLFDPMDPAVSDLWLRDYTKYCAETRSNPQVISFLNFSKKHLYQTPAPGSVAFPSLRTWSMLARACDRADKKGQTVSQDVACGLVGAPAATEFLAFAKHKHEVPTFSEICADPKKAKLPDRKNLGANFFVAGMICHEVDRKSWPACSVYLNRLPRELDAASVGMMREEMRSTILGMPEGIDWLNRVSDLLA